MSVQSDLPFQGRPPLPSASLLGALQRSPERVEDAIPGRSRAPVGPELPARPPTLGIVSSTPPSHDAYPDFTFRVESLAEICASKIRTLIERRKCRDYFDLWKLLGLEIDFECMKRILPKKLAVKGLTTVDLVRMFPDDLPETLQPYWDRELSRLVEPVPEMSVVLEELRQRLMVMAPLS